MSTVFIRVSVGLIYVVWGGIVVAQWMSARSLQRDVYKKYAEDGTLNEAVTEAEFAKMFMRVEGPRFSLYLFGAACLVPFIIGFGVRIFNFIWGIVWRRTGELPWFEVGELPHSLMLIFLYVGILFCVAWVTMRTYHLRASGSFKSELKRLNGE